MPAVILFLNIALFLVLFFAGGIIIRRIVLLRKIPVSLCLFLILPVGQLFTLHSFSYKGWSIYWLLGLLLSVAASVLFLFYAIFQEKKTITQEKLRIIQHKMELEKSHYAAVELRREELANIRQDFNKKLEAVAGLVYTGKDKKARDTIALLAEKIEGTKENTYCGIPVINAILTQKEKTCTQGGITLKIDLNLPDIVGVEPMHLCSIFGNILDNAIDACQKVKGEKQAIIQLTSIMDGDYLFIKTTNPSHKPNLKPAPGRGYGQKIVSELAKQYEGDFYSQYQQGIFTAVVSLAVVKR